MCAFPMAEMQDNENKARRPTVTGKINNQDVKFLVDTGASISVINEKMFHTIWAHWQYFRLPMPTSLRITGITG